MLSDLLCYLGFHDTEISWKKVPPMMLLEFTWTCNSCKKVVKEIL